MSYIFRVVTLQCDGLEPSVEHAYFAGDQVEAAIMCAKTHLREDESTVVQILQLGENGTRGIVWMHNPQVCSKECPCGRHADMGADAVSIRVEVSGPHTKRSEQIPEGVGTQPRYQSMCVGLVS